MILLGEQRSGRSTVLQEVARRATEEGGRLIVQLHGRQIEAGDRSTALKRVLTALVESLARQAGGETPAWYRAWRDRVYLRDCGPCSSRDLLSSALVLAANPQSDIDTTIIEHDLRALLSTADDAGFANVILTIDDASTLTEDPDLIEELLGIVEAVSGYRLLLASLPSTSGHFVDAASPCLTRFLPVWLRPFWGLHQIYVSLSAPLSGSAEDWVRADDTSFLRDVMRLTGGNPYELMLVAHHLWTTCERGEQERYMLTPRLLDRVIPHLALLASSGDALLDGAQAIDRLPESHVRQAVDLAALSRMSTREIAIMRTLKAAGRDIERVDRSILTADIDAVVATVVAELEELEAEGIVQLHDDRTRFNVVGGPAVAVLLKYKARARLGADVSNNPFELGFLPAVAPALVRDATERVLDSLAGTRTLAYSAIMSSAGAGRYSPRPAIRALSVSNDFRRLVQAEVDLMAWGTNEFTRISELLAEESPVLGLVYTAVSYGREELEYTELWEMPPGVTQEELGEVWSGVIEEWEPVVAAAELKWTGSEFAVIDGELARQVLVVLQRFAAMSAVETLFRDWHQTRNIDLLRRASRIADEAVATMRATALSEVELGGELSGMLSRSGFLKSFDDATLTEARFDLEEALRTGDADTWVTTWNLANVMARLGDNEGALKLLAEVQDRIRDWTGTAFLLVFIPGREATNSILNIGHEGLQELLALQEALISVRAGHDTEVVPKVASCSASADLAVQEAARWVVAAMHAVAEAEVPQTT